MREWIERTFSAQVITWAEWDDDGERYEVLANGRLIVADSLGLLIEALNAQRAAWPPLRLAA